MVAFQADQNACFKAEGAAVFYFRHRITGPYELQPAGISNERKRSEACCCTTTGAFACCHLFARKPDPRRVSKQVSREPPQAWLFGLVRLAPQAERTKSAAGRRKAPQASQFSAPQAEKIRGVLRSPCSSRSGFACAALAEQQHVPPLVIHKGPREGKSLLQKRLLCCFSFFTRAMRKGGAPRPSPAPKQEGIRIRPVSCMRTR